MPIFDFECQDCGKSFDKMLAYIDKDKVHCPECDSSNLKKLYSPFKLRAGECRQISHLSRVAAAQDVATMGAQ